MEPLEGRQLLSVYTGLSKARNILTSSGVYSVQVDGPGILRVGPAGKGAINLNVLGTTSDSSLSITQVRSRWHAPSQFLTIRNLNIKSGLLDSIHAGRVQLDGTMTPLSNSMTTLDLGGLGPNAQIDINGSVGGMSVQQVDLGPNGHVVIAGDLNGGGQDQGGSMSIASMNIDGGLFSIGRDSLAPIAVASNLTLSHGGRFIIGRDQSGSFSVGGSMVLDTGGLFTVGRNLTSLSVNGDLLVNSGGSGIAVGGSLNGLTVNGVFRGQGSPSAIDLGVGLNLNGFAVLGGTTNQGGLLSANISVGKNINEMNIAHGIFDSWITAGVSITGVTVGADGVVAIQNSEIDAGTTINNVTADGDVKSDFPTNPSPKGYPTRIVAGKTRDGHYFSDGQINNFTINGSLIDSVLAASVAPYGGDGTLPPPVPYGGQPRVVGAPPGDGGYNTYDAPGGVTDKGNGQLIKNYSVRSTVGGNLLNVAVWDTTIDPTIDDTILDNGTITVTVTGSVISSSHDDRFDYTGILAVNTEGVNGGPLP